MKVPAAPSGSTRSLIGASRATTDGGRSPQSWSQKRRRTGWRAPVSPPVVSVAKGPNIGSDGGTQMCNRSGTLSQTQQSHCVLPHDESALGRGELRLREGIDIAACGQQRLVGTEEQAIGAAQVGDRAICRRRV